MAAEQLSVQMVHDREHDAQQSPVSFHGTHILIGPLPGARPAHSAGPVGSGDPSGHRTLFRDKDRTGAHSHGISPASPRASPRQSVSHTRLP